jgi:hypothetical protein
MELGPLINIIPNHNRYTVMYRGQVVKDVTGAGVGVYAHIIDGKIVPDEDLDEWYIEQMLFDWRGRQFGLIRYRDGLVSGGYGGSDNAWAAEQGLEGSPYDGWYLLDAPEDEIENVRVEKHDSLASQNYRRTFKVEPPQGLFTYVRPATEQEWIKE